MGHRVTLIPGEGIGPEIMRCVQQVIEALQLNVEWETTVAGQEALAKTGRALPEEVLDSLRRNRVGLKGPIGTPIGEGFVSVNVSIRKALDLFVSLRPVKNRPGIASRYENVDLVIVRENTEGMYSGLEHEVVPGVVESLKIISRPACERIVDFAFKFARDHGRKKVTAVHKANIMKMSDGLFLEVARGIAPNYPGISYDERIVDAAAMKLVRYPERYDVLVMENLYGDILSDVAAGLVGGLGVVPGANLGKDCAVFEAVHGSAPDIAGKGIANPMAMLLSAAMMLRHLNETDGAERVERAIDLAIADGKATPDIGGLGNTASFTQAIIERL